MNGRNTHLIAKAYCHCEFCLYCLFLLILTLIDVVARGVTIVTTIVVGATVVSLCFYMRFPQVRLT